MVTSAGEVYTGQCGTPDGNRTNTPIIEMFAVYSTYVAQNNSAAIDSPHNVGVLGKTLTAIRR